MILKVNVFSSLVKNSNVFKNKMHAQPINNNESLTINNNYLYIPYTFPGFHNTDTKRIFNSTGKDNITFFGFLDY